MIKVINEEQISFASRLNQLMKEKGVSNGTVANYIGTTKATVSSWRNGHSIPTRFVDEIYSKLALEFDVDVEYLKCTQIEKKLIQEKPSRRMPAKVRMRNRVKRLLPEELHRAEKQIQKYRQTQQAVKILQEIGIEIYPAEDLISENHYVYQLLSDHSIFTLLQTEEVSCESKDLFVILPDGSKRRKNADDLIQACDSIRRFAMDQFR